jgi:hypothetical protein
VAVADLQEDYVLYVVDSKPSRGAIAGRTVVLYTTGALKVLARMRMHGEHGKHSE